MIVAAASIVQEKVDKLSLEAKICIEIRNEEKRYRDNSQAALW